MTKAEIQTRF